MSIYYDLDEEAPRIIQPKGLGNVKLKPHQLTILKAMLEVEEHGCFIIDTPDVTSELFKSMKSIIQDEDEITTSIFKIETNSAILADKVGAGKTYDILALILARRIPPQKDRFVLGSNFFSMKMLNQKKCVKTNLLVVPHNLTTQWKYFLDQTDLEYMYINSANDYNEFFDIDFVERKDIGKYQQNGPFTLLRTVKIIPKNSGSKKKMKNILERKVLNKKKVEKALAKYDVIILNVNRYILFQNIFKSVKWARVLIDEMDSAHIPQYFSEYGVFNWFITATPEAIFKKSCKSYVNKIFGHNKFLIKYFTVKNNNTYVDQSLVLPPPHVFLIDAHLKVVIEALQELIPQEVLNMINAGNMKEAIKHLNCDVDTKENIANILTKNIEKELHNSSTELNYVKELDIDKKERDDRIKKIKQKITSCKTRLESIREKLDSIKVECCLICTEKLDTPAIMDCCKNIFCMKCIIESLKTTKNKCPNCRTLITSSKQYHIIVDNTETKKKKKVSNEESFIKKEKHEIMTEILKYIAKHDDNPKILIFSDYSDTFINIASSIKKSKLRSDILAGTSVHIECILKRYFDEDLNILMLDSKRYGSGLNLQNTNYLIFYHRMNNDLETQVIGRAQRYGREKPLSIFYLVNSNENHNLKISSNPCILDNMDDLSLITDFPEQEYITQILNEDNDSNEDYYSQDDDVEIEMNSDKEENRNNKLVTKKMINKKK